MWLQTRLASEITWSPASASNREADWLLPTANGPSLARPSPDPSGPRRLSSFFVPLPVCPERNREALLAPASAERFR